MSSTQLKKNEDELVGGATENIRKKTKIVSENLKTTYSHHKFYLHFPMYLVDVEWKMKTEPRNELVSPIVSSNPIKKEKLKG
jgi:hypothetical protein